MNIFVSYTTRNNEVSFSLLSDLSQKINSFGKIFIDLFDNNSTDKQGRIIEELNSANLLLFIKSKSSLNSDWVIYELESARKIGLPILEIGIDTIHSLTEEDIKEKIDKIFCDKPSYQVGVYAKSEATR